MKLESDNHNVALRCYCFNHVVCQICFISSCYSFHNLCAGMICFTGGCMFERRTNCALEWSVSHWCLLYLSETVHRGDPVCLHLYTRPRGVGHPVFLGAVLLPGCPEADQAAVPSPVWGASGDREIQGRLSQPFDSQRGLWDWGWPDGTLLRGRGFGVGMGVVVVSSSVLRVLFFFTFTHAHACIYAHTHTCVHTHAHVRMHTYTHTLTHTHTHTLTHTHTHTYTLTHSLTHLLTHSFTHTHTLTHTHTHARRKKQSILVSLFSGVSVIVCAVYCLFNWGSRFSTKNVSRLKIWMLKDMWLWMYVKHDQDNDKSSYICLWLKVICLLLLLLLITDSLPQTLRHSHSTSSFKAALKTHLFNNYF